MTAKFFMKSGLSVAQPTCDEAKGHHFIRTTGWQNRKVIVIGTQDKPLVEQWYLLGLFDYSSIMQLFRMNDYSHIPILQSIRHLLAWGIPFVTLKPYKNPPDPTRMAPCKVRSLGHRPSRYKFTDRDYNEYEVRREELLSGSIGRVALTRGGIIGRLAKDVIDGSKLVTRGPGHIHDNSVVVTELDGFYLCEELLTQQQQDIICGVYEVDTGKFSYNSLTWRMLTGIFRPTWSGHENVLVANLR
jgi:hypothetical protein